MHLACYSMQIEIEWKINDIANGQMTNNISLYKQSYS